MSRLLMAAPKPEASSLAVLVTSRRKDACLQRDEGIALGRAAFKCCRRTSLLSAPAYLELE
jgi:hypothetical protein